MNNKRPGDNNPFNFGPGRNMPFNIGNNDPTDTPIKQALKKLASDVLPLMTMLRLDPSFEANIENQIAQGFQAASDSLYMGGAASKIDEFSSRLRAISRQDVEEGLQKFLQASDDDAMNKEAVRIHKLQVMDMTEEDMVNLYKLRNSAMPPVLRQLDEMADGKSAEEYAREIYKKYTTLSVDELIKDRKDYYANYPVEAFVDSIYEMTQKATPDAVDTLAKEVLLRTSPQQISGIVMGALDVINDGLATVIKHDRIGVSNAAVANAVGKKLADFFNAVTDSFVAAGIVPDTDLKAAFKAAYPKKGPTPPTAPGSKGGKPSQPKGPKMG